MALIKTIDEVTKYVDNVSADLGIAKLLPKVNRIEDDVIIPHIGRDFYVEIEAAYQATPTTIQQYVIDYLQEAIANLAVAIAMDTLAVTIGDNGTQRHENGNDKTAYRYQTDEAKRQLNLAGWKVLENLLAFLEENKVNYPTWVGSSAYTVNKELIINSADVFDQHYPIGQSRLMYNGLKHQIKLVEDMELAYILSDAFLAEIKAEIAAASVSAANQTLLDNFIYKAVANLAIARGLADSVAMLNESGVVVYERIANATTDAEIRAAGMDRVGHKRVAVQNNGVAYLDKLRDYLNANASDSLYATYFGSSKYVAPVVDDGSVAETSTFLA